ncbi:DUF3597 domain-containing protein [Aureimonas sp. AU20]|uniref:DUF3597 domain-containing protein n=1 Tax=Aureimonas sp. AU20 TaxID=1349819 RepID=UPI000722C4EE|nr:DUF3597 domain-containing protein [Aureimonas sp. AU20]ALN71283.1 hypothetical protein M673_01075 [Aureimonas sp. AU20]
MGFFDRIRDKIFGSAEAAEPAPAPAAPSPAPAGGASASTGGAPAAPQPAPSSAPAAPASAPATSAAPATAPAGAGAGASQAPSASVDVAAILEGKAKAAGQPLDWRHSIVDLLKLLDIDSSLSARKELAEELHYTGDTGDSAAMNTWLHKAVMKKLAENGGQVPAELRD